MASKKRTDRAELIKLIDQGKSQTEVAEILWLRQCTVSYHVKHRDKPSEFYVDPEYFARTESFRKEYLSLVRPWFTKFLAKSSKVYPHYISLCAHGKKILSERDMAAVESALRKWKKKNPE